MSCRDVENIKYCREVYCTLDTYELWHLLNLARDKLADSDPVIIAYIYIYLNKVGNRHFCAAQIYLMPK